MNTYTSPQAPRGFALLALLLSLALAASLSAQTTPASAPNSTPPRAPDGPTVPTATEVQREAQGRTANADNPTVLTTFTVREEQDIGYESMHTTSGMRTVQELRNLANSISIMNAQFIEDTASLTIEEMAKWFVSGEDNPEPNALVDGRVIMRGIPNLYAMRNGGIWYSPMDAYSTERVEILRGANAFLYGEADVGGGQNQVTKRGLFTRDITRFKVMFGSDELRRGEIDLNRRLVHDKLALRVAAVRSYNESWTDNVKRDLRGIYLATTYRPFRDTTINLMAEHAETTQINSQGLFNDAFSRTGTSNIAASGGYIYVPAASLQYRAQGAGRINSTGPGTTIIDPSIVPKHFHSAGPTSTFENFYQSIMLEIEHHVGKNLHLQISGIFYNRKIDVWGVAAGRNIFRDRNAMLPNGQPNPYFNELYTEYFRTRRVHGNMVRDMRFSAVYDINTSWMKQQLLLNLSQHQDNPYHKKPAYGEYVDHTSAAWVGAQPNMALTQAAYTSNRALFTGNRFMRRYYFQRDGVRGNDDLGPVPGVSAWYPDLSNAVGAGGHQINRRFYTPSYGIGASGSYFKNHLFTHVGYRRDAFNMKTSFGIVRPTKDEFQVEHVPDAFLPNPSFTNVTVDGANYGGVLRVNDSFALGYNWAQSFRISFGEGALTYKVGERQGVPVGEGEDYSARFSLLKDKSGRHRLEFTAVRYKNFRPNDRFNPNPNQMIRDELEALFPDTFMRTGQDYQTTTTRGYEFELMANPTRNWRMTLNWATNKVVTENRVPLLKGFQAEAKKLNQPTPLLDEFLTTIPEGVPNAGYTKERANFFTRYTFTEGPLKGAYVGGGLNFRLRTYRGMGDHDSDLSTPAVAMWSPAYTLYTFLAGYSTKILERRTSFALNVNNVADKAYFRSTGISSGSWGDPRSFRLTMTTEF